MMLQMARTADAETVQALFFLCGIRLPINFPAFASFMCKSNISLFSSGAV